MITPYHTIAFYNLENLFDTFDDKFTFDDDFLPNSEKNWTKKRYRKKVSKLGYAISNIGVRISKKYPAIVGLAEVENKLVIDDLLNSKFLKDKSYDYVHYDSPDERGIDVAMIYDTTVFEVINTEVFGIIQSELLKKKLSTYPSTFAAYKEFEDVNRDIVINKHRALGEQYTSILRLDKSLLGISEPHKSDFLGWARDPQHQNNKVNRINIIRNKLIPALIEVQAKNYEILKLLDEEIRD